MRVPPSLLVMSVVTAVPFGLAIRDTIAGTTRGDELDLTGEHARERELAARLAREQLQQRMSERAHQLAQEANLASLYGRTPASLGSLFDGVTLGRAADSFQTEAARDRVMDARTNDGIDVVYDTDGDKLYSIAIQVPQLACDRLHQSLERTWGPSISEGWLDEATHQRASFAVDECFLYFDQFVSVDAWVAQIPIDAIGKPLAELEAKLGPPVNRAHEGSARWRLPGVGRDRGTTRVDADSSNGNVVYADIIATTDLTTQEQIRDLLSERLRVPAVQMPGDPNAWTWETNPRVTLEVSGAYRFLIQIGTPTWQ